MRDDKNGTLYVGDGCWGAAPRQPDDVKPWTLLSGSFHHVHWVQVFPATEEQDAFMEIRTVMTAVREKGKVVSLVKRVADVTEADVFTPPENLKLYAPEPHGAVVRVPFAEK